MAFKTFINGVNLPATDVNDYLMKQSVMTFASSGARASALTVPVEGMFTYLADVDRYEFWNGTSWQLVDSGIFADSASRTSGVTSPVEGIQSFLKTTSATDTANQIDFYNGSAWESIYTPGRNFIINGAMDWWQRGTSFTGLQFSADRWGTYSDKTFTVSQQTFTPGSAPVTGYESQFYVQIASSTTGTYLDFGQRVEDVRTLAGQTVTLSFWGKIASGTLTFSPRFDQNFGSGGSAMVYTNTSNITLTTTWQRFSITVALPSVAGKTINAGSYLQVTFPHGAGAQTTAFWGVQLEAGSVATPFRRAGGTLQEELAACQRYYIRYNVDATSAYGALASGFANSTANGIDFVMQFPVAMRTTPSSTLDVASPTGFFATDSANSYCVDGNMALDTYYKSNLAVKIRLSGGTNPTTNAFRPHVVGIVGTGKYLGLSAEL